MVRPVEVDVVSDDAYELVFEGAETRRRVTYDAANPDRLEVDEGRAVAELVAAVHRARHDALPVHGRELLRLSHVAALPDGTVELLFEAGEVRRRFVCAIEEVELRGHRLQLIHPEPEMVIMDPGCEEPDVGDPRPAYAVVMAMYRAMGSPAA